MKTNTMMINPAYATAILTLANALTEHNVPHTLNVIWDGLQIRFPWNPGDIICHSGSYGHEYGDVESMGCPWDEGDVSCMNLDDMLEGILRWYDAYKFEKGL
jgi:hypothetical protein